MAAKPLCCPLSSNTHLTPPNVTCMAAVAVDGSQIPPTLLFKDKRIARLWYDKDAIPLSLRGTRTGWLSAENFVDWIQNVSLREVTPSEHPLGKVLLALDGSCTHYKPELLQMCKSKGVEILLLPLKCTDILQPLEQAVLCSLKR